jgi:hypothetical protein
VVVLAMIAGATDARAQGVATPPVVAAPGIAPLGGTPDGADAGDGAALTIYLLTIGQGDLVFQRFGHNALWIRDAARGTDVAYNWGMFDFDQPNFLGRFLTGDTRYWMEGFDALAMVRHYAEVEQRSVWAQELALTPMQRAALRDYVEWNAREENKFYRYDYYRDNCSTRVRDALDRALGGALRQALVGRPTGTSYRSHTRRLVAGDAPIYAGIQIALGRPADAPIDAWEEAFLPVRLMTYARELRVPGPDGAAIPLVRSERTLYTAPRAPERAAAPSYLVGALVVGVAIGGVLAALGRVAAQGGAGGAPALALLGGVWLLLTGVLGTALLLAGTVTRHVFMARNLNLLAVNPLALVALVLLLLALGTRRPASRARAARRAERAVGLVAALAAVGALLELTPLGQRSGEVFALVLPTHLGLWWALRTLVAARGIDGPLVSRTPAHTAGATAAA